MLFLFFFLFYSALRASVCFIFSLDSCLNKYLPSRHWPFGLIASPALIEVFRFPFFFFTYFVCFCHRCSFVRTQWTASSCLGSRPRQTKEQAPFRRLLVVHYIALHIRIYSCVYSGHFNFSFFHWEITVFDFTRFEFFIFLRLSAFKLNV